MKCNVIASCAVDDFADAQSWCQVGQLFATLHCLIPFICIAQLHQPPNISRPTSAARNVRLLHVSRAELCAHRQTIPQFINSPTCVSNSAVPPGASTLAVSLSSLGYSFWHCFTLSSRWPQGRSAAQAGKKTTTILSSNKALGIETYTS